MYATTHTLGFFTDVSVGDVYVTEQGEDQVYTWRKFVVTVTVGRARYQSDVLPGTREEAQRIADAIRSDGVDLNDPQWHEEPQRESYREYCERAMLGGLTDWERRYC